MQKYQIPLAALSRHHWWRGAANYWAHEGRGVATFIGCGVLLFGTWLSVIGPNDLRRADILRVRELANLRRTVGDQLWPGWQQNDSPVLLVKPGVEYLFDHPQPPDGFREMQPISGAGHVCRESGHILPQLGMCALPLNKVPTVIVPDKRSFDQLGSLIAADESFLGGFTRHDVTDHYLVMCLHEAFHAYQQSAGMSKLLQRLGLEGEVPSTAASAMPAASAADALEWAKLARLNDPQIKQRLADAESVERTQKLLANECRTLAAALESADSQTCRNKAQEFLKARNIRRQAMASATANLTLDEIANFEQAMEWVEGMARYTEGRLCATLKSGAYTPTLEMAGDLDFMGYRQLHPPDEVTVAEAFQRPTRSRCYVTGANLCCLLDRLDASWKNKALHAGMPLEQLVADACQ